MAKNRKSAGTAFFIPDLGYLSHREKATLVKRLQAVTVPADDLPPGAIALLREKITGQVEVSRKARQFLGR